MKKLLFSSLFFLIISNGFAQNFNSKRLDSLFQLLDKNNKYMGSIAVSENGKIIYSNAIGYDDIATSKKSDAQTKYRIGSISKMFTASLIFKAIEEKKLNLNQTIDKYFPTVKNSNKITISNLLNHRSGIYNFTSDKNYAEWQTQYQSKEKMIERISSGEIVFEPDTKGEYSNSNYVLLTFIIEAVYKKSYSEILNQKIIKHLQLKNTYYGGKINLDTKECNSYTFSGEWKKSTETDLSIPQGAGALVSNPTDLTIFIKNLFAGKIISLENVTLMKTIKDKYGMGMFEYPYFERKSYGHSGGIDGFRSLLSYFEKEKLAVALTSNGLNYDLNNIVLCALSSYFNKPFEMPNFEKVTLKTEILDQYLGTYASLEIPLKITITKKEASLMAQATGQSAFPLEANSTTVFKFDQAGVVLEFKASEKQMTLNQGGKEFLFTKE
ncbi:serine hydrolase domain-containing protein [Flavobacterium sp. Fl-77]|uniref:Serine hydrolase domain-containing protein n=1 Tax=Flavobacterium flavipigmentatum TaxID=2893884 RepID=A0AAJ2VW13_9FLAO|nr:MULTISPECIES: serine hydrolase domain-containing protein [unclassified Flavobacterium]MDX6181584.1 serine hydrolase domain-containing protein [Flavobacterium sp. Fl-33]MDX6185382.1 serine hydrolase domain-containing protein [Flavobacterium sp. Fl-77]UFH37485.1 beta-lactamase family protein [Flavobacterium sp. F-70]